MKHQFQHPDSPTWCIHCSTFDTHCIPDEECPAEPTGKYDYTKPENLDNFFVYRALKHWNEKQDATETVIDDHAENFDVGREG